MKTRNFYRTLGGKLLLLALLVTAVGAPKHAHAAELLTPVVVTPDLLSPQPVATTPTLRIGFYVGALSEQALWPITSCKSTLLCPWTIRLTHDYIIDSQGVYTFYRFARLPIDLELEGGVAQRFGWDHQSEFDLIPIARWKAFPWNNYVFTNFRAGLLGASYATGVSPWERKNAENRGKGSNYLNFLRLELTFAPSAESPWEVFAGLHHRSGIFGLINHSHGGSNYWETGLRFNVF
jgi:hypothetical protein